ncbi:MAG: CerR family C-terminal domain-containing protein [Verrucomicrobiales bacterium]|jgi:AcrR family transcriptional regulator|nr:CerR family C-terminal domain-containing protein [Verrucomicrobiales bacterium]
MKPIPQRQRRSRSDKNRSRQRGIDAQQRLLNAGLRVFAVTSYRAASIREISRLAGTNVAAIRYHFGGKLELFKAVAAHVAEKERDRQPLPPASCALFSRVEAAAQLHHTMRDFMLLVLQPGMEPYSRFLFQQFFDGGLGFQILHREVLNTRVTKIATLLARLANLPDSTPFIRLQALALIGEVVIFRFGKLLVLKTLAWRDYNAEALTLIESVIHARVKEIIDHPKTSASGI